MKRAIVAEMLRSVSGLSFLGVLLFLFLIPLFVLIQTNDMDAITSMGATEVSQNFYEPVTATFITVMFLGSYSVTREFYYNSIDRTLIQSGTFRLLASKISANAIVGAILTLGLAISWALIVSWWLPSYGQSFTPNRSTVAIIVSSLLVCIPASLMGCLLGWIVRNYYVATGIVLLLPLAIEMPLLTIAPGIARFLPGNALSGVAGFTTHDGLLPWPLSLLVVIFWGALAVTASWQLERRRDI